MWTSILDIDTQLNFSEIIYDLKRIYILLNPANALERHQCSQGSLKTCFIIQALLVEVLNLVSSLNSLYSSGYNKVL